MFTRERKKRIEIQNILADQIQLNIKKSKYNDRMSDLRSEMLLVKSNKQYSDQYRLDKLSELEEKRHQLDCEDKQLKDEQYKLDERLSLYYRYY